MPHLARRDCRPTLFHAPGFMSKTATRWLGAIATTLLLIAGGRQDAEAELIINFSEAAGDVVATWSGSLDMTGITGVAGTLAGNPAPYTELRDPGHFFQVDTVGPNAALTYINPWASVPGDPFKSGANVISDSSSGGFMLIYSTPGSNIVTTPSLISGDIWSPSGSATWNGASFASLGLNPGSYTWTVNNVAAEQIVLTVGVPEPTTALGLLGLVTGAFFRRRRRLLV